MSLVFETIRRTPKTGNISPPESLNDGGNVIMIRDHWSTIRRVICPVLHLTANNGDYADEVQGIITNGVEEVTYTEPNPRNVSICKAGR